MGGKQQRRSKRGHNNKRPNKVVSASSQGHDTSSEVLTVHNNNNNNNHKKNNNQNEPTCIEYAEMVQKMIGNDVVFQKEVDLLLDMMDHEHKKLDPKKLRKMPKLLEQLANQHLEPAALGAYIGQRFIMKDTNNTDTTQKQVTCSGNKYLASHVALGVAKLIVDQPEDSPELTEVVTSIQAEVSQALLEYLDLTGFSIEETMSEDFCATLIDLECRKWAPALDKLVFYDEVGAFLRQCPVYRRPASDIRPMMEEIMAQTKKGFSDNAHKAKLIHHTVAMSALAIAQNVDRVNRDCWECGKVCKKNLSACSCCKTANYCSATCQRKAWSSGHKSKCKALASNFCLYQNSLDVMDAVHAGEEFQQLTLREEKVDYRIFSHIFTSPAESFKKGTMKGPSMNYFYQNMERIQNDGWWVLSVKLSLPHYHQALAQWGDNCLEEELSFLNLAHVLCYDLVGFYGPRMQMERIGNPQLKGFSDLELVAMAATSDLGFGPRRRHPRVTGIPMPAARFLQLYKHYGAAYDVGKLWSHTKRQLQKQVLKDFRDEHHK